MKNFITIFLLFSTTCFSQIEKKVDSLQSRLDNELDVSKKIEILEALHSTLLYNKPDVALNYSLEALRLSLKSDDKKAEVKAYYNLGTAYMTIHEMDSAKYYHRKTAELAKELGDEMRLANAMSSLANTQRLDGDFEESIASYEAAKEIFSKHKEYLALGVVIGNIGSIYMDQGNYIIAQQKSMLALKVLDTIPREPYRKADILRRIGHIQYQIENYPQSIEYYNKALKVYISTDDNVYASETYLEIGTSFTELKEYDKAIENLQKGLEIAKEFGLKGTEDLIYSNLGAAYRKAGDYNKSEYFLKKSYVFQLDRGFVNNKIGAHVELGNLYIDMKAPQKAILYLDEALKIADSVNSVDYLMSVYHLRSQSYELLGNTLLALEDLKKHQVYKDSIFSSKKIQQIEELKTIYETEKKEAALALQEEEINTLNEKAKVDRLTKGLYAGGALSGLAFSGLLFFGFRQRMKKNIIAREKQEQIYKQEIAHKKKELASQTLHLVQKNTFIQELKVNLENLRNSPEKFKMGFRRIVLLLKKENASDKDWEVFKSYFADVHNNFDNKLKTYYADITEKEIRLAAFLRMNLSTKEIAAMLNVLPDSVLKSKYRLKKKLSLAKETDFNSFLNTL